MANQNLSPMQKKTKTTEKRKIIDPCPICNKELHLNHEYTQRVGLIGDMEEVLGWLCPHCRSEFDTDDRITKFQGEGSIRGEA